jgi:hypothetical protein
MPVSFLDGGENVDGEDDGAGGADDDVRRVRPRV